MLPPVALQGAQEHRDLRGTEEGLAVQEASQPGEPYYVQSHGQRNMFSRSQTTTSKNKEC